MPVSTKSLISVIKQNKNKKLIASKVIETNPKILPIIPKLIQDRTAISSIERDDIQVNRSVLEDLYNRLRIVQQNNTHITKLFPDIELSIQILVSSILSPKKMTDIQLNYKLSKAISIDSNVSSKLLDIIKTYINDNYNIEDKLPEIVREALFTSGAYVQAIIPEASIDEVINTDLLPSYSTEDFKSKVDYLIDLYVKPINLVTSNAKVTYTDVELKDKNKLVSVMASESYINITDNINILNFSKLKDKLTSTLIRDSFKTNTSIAAESLNKINYIDIFREKSNQTGKSLEFIKKKTETRRKSLGRPLVSKIPTESIIPVFIPGNESEHIGYFVLLDETGKPLSTEIRQNNISNISSNISQSPTSQLSPIQKAYKNLISDSTQGFNINELFEMYKDVLERQIYTSVKSSLYGTINEISERNDIYFLMFTRALANQKTNLLFIPKELIVYFAFQYNETGTGKTLLENLTILSSMRAILLFSKVMAYAKQSIDVTKVNISLDPNDPDPEKTIEQIQDSVLKLRQNFFPLGMNNPVDLLNWIQRAGLQFSYENNPLIPNVKIDFENANLGHTLPSSELEEDLRKQSIISLGLSPETVDNGFTPEFATTVVNNNILLSKRISIYQKALTKHLTKYVDLIIYNDEELRGILTTEIIDSISILSESLTEEEKHLLNKDRDAFIDYYISNISRNIEIHLPKPDNTNISTLSAEYDIYKENLEKVIESIISADIFSQDISGEISNHIDTIKNIWKHYLLRKWMAENNFYPEVLELYNEDAEDTENMLATITNHLSSTMRNSDSLIKLMQKFKLAADRDLSNLDGEGATSTPTSTDESSNTQSSDKDGIVDDTDLSLDF